MRLLYWHMLFRDRRFQKKLEKIRRPWIKCMAICDYDKLIEEKDKKIINDHKDDLLSAASKARIALGRLGMKYPEKLKEIFIWENQLLHMQSQIFN